MHTADTARELAGRLVKVINNLMAPTLTGKYRRTLILCGPRTDEDELLLRLKKGDDNRFKIDITSPIVIQEFVDSLRETLRTLFKHDERVSEINVEVGDIKEQFRTITKVPLHD